MLSNSIKSDVAKLWDKFWSGGIANPLTAIEQISYLIFMKRLDEEDTKKKVNAEFLNRPFTSVFDGQDDDGIDNQSKRWSRFKFLKGDEMLMFMQEKVFPFIKNINGSNTFTHHMKDAVFLIPKPSLLVEAVNIIDSIYENIEKDQKDGQTFQDTQGDIYEYLLSEIASAGKNGQFRTPRHIIQMICALVNPKLGDEICDPACGTGGFLLGAYQHIMTQYTSPENRFVDDTGIERGTVADKLTDPRQWQAIKEKTFYGYDFDSTMVRIGLMNLMLHGIDQPNVDYKDTLSKKFTDEDRFDVVLANPPFKGSIDKGDINENLSINTTKTELLFVNRIINLLRLGGKAGVIVPDGVLFGSSNAHKDLRKMLIEKCELQGVVSMPSGIFKPYAGVSTAVLIFVKGGETKNVWFYDMKADGFTLDDKRTKISDNDIPDIIKKWNERNLETDTNRKLKAFFVPRKEIEAGGYDLSINKYKETEYEEVKYEDPKIILEKIENLGQEIAAGTAVLKNL
jgi:type I restriction enzyme M protein